MADLTRARQVKQAVEAYMHEHGVSRAQARHALGLAPGRHKGRAAAPPAAPMPRPRARSPRQTGMVQFQGGGMMPYFQPQAAPQPQVIYVGGPPAPARQRAHPRRHAPRDGESIVPTPGGEDVTIRGKTTLHANYGGHVVVEFDKVALGATLSGLIHQLRHGGTVAPEAVFPELFPREAEALLKRRSMAQERTIGGEMAKLLGVALRAYGVTQNEWAEWFVRAYNSAVPMPIDGVQSGGGMGSPLGAPTYVTSPLGAAR